MRQVIARYVADPIAPHAPAPDVTPREKQVWQLVAEGLSNTEIEDRLFISHATCGRLRTEPAGRGFRVMATIPDEVTP